MNRILTYNVAEASQGMTINAFLKQRGFSAQNLIDLKKNEESVLLNKAFAYQNKVLQSGDVLTIQIIENEHSPNIIPVELPIDIAYEDEDLIVINKPANMPIHPSMDNYDNSMANALAWYYQKQGKAFVFRCINRLDRDTSGLTIVAKHKVSAGILGTMTSKKSLCGGEDGIEREYLAIVKGIPESQSGIIDAPIARKEGSVLERVVDFEKGERAVTHYRVLQTANGYSLVSLKLETGRTHQIRVHMKHIGHPLIGDFLYYQEMGYIKRQALHSYRLSFQHPITGKKMNLTAPLPEDMKNALDKIGGFKWQK